MPAGSWTPVSGLVSPLELEAVCLQGRGEGHEFGGVVGQRFISCAVRMTDWSEAACLMSWAKTRALANSGRTLTRLLIFSKTIRRHCDPGEKAAGTPTRVWCAAFAVVSAPSSRAEVSALLQAGDEDLPGGVRGLRGLLREIFGDLLGVAAGVRYVATARLT